MSKLLLDEYPLIILPNLAVKIGLNEAIVMQQLHYWLKESKNVKDGYKWVYNTYEDWQKQFPFWSVSTIKRIVSGLEKEGLILTGNYNKLKIDRTKWYRINYEKFDALMEQSTDQDEPSIVSNWSDGEINLNQPLPEITTEITTDKPTTTTAFQFYEQNFGQINSYLSEEIGCWIDDFNGEHDVIIEALKIALERNKRNWGYVKAILKDWHSKNALTLQDVQALQVETKPNDRKPKKQAKQGGHYAGTQYDNLF